MNRSLPISVVVGVGALFSGYHVVLGIFAVLTGLPEDPLPSVAAMALYLVATAVSLAPWSQATMPVWMAAFNLATVVCLSLLVTSAVDPTTLGADQYATWHVAAVGTLMTITSARGRHSWAWSGIAYLAAHTALWGGVGAVALTGVIGSIAWVAMSHSLAIQMGRAAREAQRYSRAARQAADWRAARDALVTERQGRLYATIAMTETMLNRIVTAGGQLGPGERQECLYLEGAIRDEVRGRSLLNSRVRDEVMAKRRTGVTVSLFDEGGLDDMTETELARVLDDLADAIAQADGDRIVVRTVDANSNTAVTVVGVRSRDPLVKDSEDEVALWREIPRHAVERNT